MLRKAGVPLLGLLLVAAIAPFFLLDSSHTTLDHLRNRLRFGNLQQTQQPQPQPQQQQQRETDGALEESITNQVRLSQLALTRPAGHVQETCPALPEPTCAPPTPNNGPLQQPPFQKGADEIVVLMWDNQWGNPFYWGHGPVC
eukprot:TRINITY_DN7684_c0_g1_i1.p2 TRINITY_DN7684_c0_g1~~TRINITY_DN7684_c0_g1_i1.p2  ORF type:complete len:143 (-),score=29.75 TRINITY_DN7684_c0_g1_i1:306-734(-)